MEGEPGSSASDLASSSGRTAFAGQAACVPLGQAGSPGGLRGGLGDCRGAQGVADRVPFLLAAHRESSFDVILSGVIPGSTTLHSAEILAEMARILRPGGRLFLKEPVETAAGKEVSVRKAGL